MELSIRLDGDRLHIQMHAANANVRDSLLMGLDRLREELAMDHGGQIELDIGQGEKHEQQDERHTAKIAEHQIEMLEPELPQQDSHLNNHIDLLA
ncbi:flagellar hook-length control protein FliK [Shewanella sp. YLB-09]|uniref:flagellar hook-length control protein FliK n=1 Tax=Shewanella sp. YLB-09 TaxID=2601269 RepID=UPI001E5CE8EE|nr:flagellar hook-length control protein FliK [Shewanella sp. YLB-09]